MSKTNFRSTPLQLFILLLAFGCDGGDRPETRAPTSNLASDAAGGTEADRAELRQLASLGYVTESTVAEPDRDKLGVTIHDPDRAQKGINVFCSENSGIVRLMDMDGEVLHRVEVAVSNPWRRSNLCKLAEFAGNDKLVMVVENTELTKVGLDSKVDWRMPGLFHHDVDVSAEGDIYAIRSVGNRVIPAFHPGIKILDDVFLVLSPTQKIMRAYSLAEMVAHEPTLMERARRRAAEEERHRPGTESVPYLDIFHSNTVEVVRERVGVHERLSFEKGDILFCARNLDTIGIIDAERKRIKWHWGIGELQMPHHPSLLRDGRILVFDNGFSRGYSRVLIVSPATGEIEWTYAGDPPESFFSRSRGGAQMLPNGNVLITQSRRGRAFEVTPEGAIVWEYWNERTGEARNARASIFRMSRLSRERLSALALDETLRTRLRDAGYL